MAVLVQAIATAIACRNPRNHSPPGLMQQDNQEPLQPNGKCLHGLPGSWPPPGFAEFALPPGGGVQRAKNRINAPVAGFAIREQVRRKGRAGRFALRAAIFFGLQDHDVRGA